MIEGQSAGIKTPALTYGMVGGGRDAFIGDVHRKAIAMDGQAVLAAGCFSRDFDNTRSTGESLGLPADRLYRTFEDMLNAEAERPDPIDFVVIVTPNNTHHPIARLALQKGIHVVCDKPLTLTAREAEELKKLSEAKDLLFGVTYTYTGYPMVKNLRDIIARGRLGKIRFVNAEYPQEWLSTPKEKTGQKQSLWRTDPEQTGASNCVGDIGSHIENMVSYLTGLRIKSLCARLDTFVEDRTLDDNASILVDYESGAKGIYWSSQIAVGHDNGLRVRVYGTQGSVEWAQEHPDHARLSFLDKPTEILSRGRDKMSARAESVSRVPPGHPEGYFEAFANIYATFITALGKKLNNRPLTDEDRDYPGLEEGLRGVRFIEKCVESSQRGAVWVDF